MADALILKFVYNFITPIVIALCTAILVGFYNKKQKQKEADAEEEKKERAYFRERLTDHHTRIEIIEYRLGDPKENHHG